VDAHFASASGFELDDAAGIGGRYRCDEFYKPRLTTCLALPAVAGHQEPLQLSGVQVQLLRGSVYALPPSNVNRH
jgi:hypothetical protein